MESQKIIDRLSAWGCDTAGALDRMLGDADFYVSLLVTYKDSFRFADLLEATVAKDAKKAFEIAHDLKGSTGNLGLTPLYKPVIEIVEPLRAGICGEAQIKKAAEILEISKEFYKVIEE